MYSATEINKITKTHRLILQSKFAENPSKPITPTFTKSNNPPSGQLPSANNNYTDGNRARDQLRQPS